MKKIGLGSLVRIAGAAALHSAAQFRPEPGQMLCAGREALVIDYRHGPDGRPLYVLKGAPGLWLEEWIEPIL